MVQSTAGPSSSSFQNHGDDIGVNHTPVRMLNSSILVLRDRVLDMYKDRRPSMDLVAKMVLVVVLCFFLCWCPYYLISLLSNFTGLLQKQNYIFSLLLIHLFGFTNSFMNPVIYALMSQAFRSGFWEILTICCPQYRDLVGPNSRSGERRSCTAVSQTEVVTDRNPAKRGYNRFFRRESTQFSAVSEQEEDRIGMTKLGKANHSSNNNNRKLINQTGPEAERKQRAERLLHKFLDEEPPNKVSDVHIVRHESNPVETPEPIECETPLIGNEDPEGGFKPSDSHGVFRNCESLPNNVITKETEDRIEDEASHNHHERRVDGSAEDQPHDPRGQQECIKFNTSISKCVAWKAANDASVQDTVVLVINDDAPNARAHNDSDVIPQIAIHNSSTADVEQLMDSEQGMAGKSGKAQNGTIPDEATTKV